MTSDKELGSLLSSTTGLALDYRIETIPSGWGVGSIGVDAKVDYLHIHYFDFLPFDTLTAWLGEIGTAVTF